ncbi:dihydroorotate dehydrogenase electron transfer subunit [Thermosulfurimonas sp. F29]|uniref:dihydroorotate dehydrogenase electron transfer subunit n=1 Tax=Thermosulfurimonas sp. F29 TaxID=2867247 RepID=UPI001C83D7AD|nr:dihydroorotate dehydrogenase electron transfer subunit [Thermosulfurimonas sp. F29]MBX6422591.1 dihydroorotate dehydrogenase electron transfer subunit [Thermosulfurimonas sp. F29]
MIRVRVKGQRRLSPGYLLLDLEAPEVAERARPGQFVRVKAWWGRDPLLPRPFSVHEVLGGRIRLLYGVRGPGTETLSRLSRGDVLLLDGPLGRPFPLPERGPVWLVAGGIGVAPFLFYLSELRNRGLPTRLFYGGRSRGDLLRVDRLRELSGALVLTTEDGSRGRKGLVTDPLSRALGRERPALMVACGPPGLLKAVGRLAEARGIPAYLSLEALMACGRGLCLGCAVARRGGGTLKVCVEGPAVDSREVDLETLV